MISASRISRFFFDCRISLGRLLSRDEDAGVAAIEFAAVVSMLTLFTICVTDLALGFYRQMQLNNAVQAGAQYAASHGFSASSITSAVSSATSFPNIQVSPAPRNYCGCPTTTGITTAVCSSNCPDGTPAGKYVSISAQGNYRTLLTYPFVPESYDLSALAQVRIP
jgi:Flp pilus assembly protein TadG